MKLPDLGATASPDAHHDLGPGAAKADEDAALANARATTNARDIGKDDAPPANVPIPERVGDLDGLDPIQIAALVREAEDRDAVVSKITIDPTPKDEE